MKIISLVNMKGGVAKTTMAVNIADCLYTRHRKKVLLVDVDPQFNATQCLMKSGEYINHIQKSDDTILDIFDRATKKQMGIASGQKVIEPKKLSEIKPFKTRRGFDIIPGSLELFKLEMATGEGREFRLKNYLTSLSEDKYDYIIIDTPPTPSVWMTSALLASNNYLIPVKPDPISLTGVDLLGGIIKEKTENYGFKINCCGVVLTIAEERTNVFKEAIRNLEGNENWNGKVFKNILPKRIKVAEEQLNQKFILDSDDTEIKRKLVGIVDELIGRVK